MLKTLFFLFMGITVTLVTSCQKEDGTSNSSNDNSIGIEFRMRNGNYGDDQVELLKVKNAFYEEYYNYYQEGYVELRISGSNNFQSIGRWTETDIVCIGNVNGLSKINSIPESGWASQVAVQPGFGYIIRSKNPNGTGYSQWCRYARVYVEKWIEGTSGGILGAVIRYQDDWKIVE